MSCSNNNIDQIDLIELLKEIWINRKILIRSIIIVTILIILIAFTRPPQYTASTTMVPQTAKSSAISGNLSSLASLAGINLKSNSDGATLSPLVYPQIVSSAPFELELMNSKFKFPNIEKKITLIDYYTRYKKESISNKIGKYTIGLPRTIINLLKKDTIINVENIGDSSIIYLNQFQDQIRKMLQRQLTIEINDQKGYITLSSSFFDASLAAQVAQKSKDMLQQYINKYKMEKAKDQLNFIHARYLEKKKAFEEAQEALAKFTDRNRYVSTALAKTEQERLQSEYNIAYDVYSTLAKQLEQAQITAKEDTPILTTIEPVQVPQQKDGIGKLIMTIIGIFLGFIVGVGIIIFKLLLSYIKTKWSESKTVSRVKKEFDQLDVS